MSLFSWESIVLQNRNQDFEFPSLVILATPNGPIMLIIFEIGPFVSLGFYIYTA